MKTTGVSSIPKFGLLDFLGHPIVDLALTTCYGRVENSGKHSTWFNILPYGNPFFVGLEQQRIPFVVFLS